MDFTRLAPVFATSHQHFDESSLEAQLDRLFPSLPPREQEILIRRFAMKGGVPELLGVIAADHEADGWTGERVRQLEGQALHRLHALLDERLTP